MVNGAPRGARQRLEARLSVFSGVVAIKAVWGLATLIRRLNMPRVRSPNYPSASLPEAVVLAGKIYDVNRTNPIDREAAAKEAGYSGLTGRSSKILATLNQYGLTEKAGKGGIRVTKRAVDILHPESAESRRSALSAAGEGPELFQQLRAHFVDGPPSESALKGWLMRREFADVAIGPAANSFLETYRYLQQERAIESHGSGDDHQADSGEQEEEDMPSSFGDARVGDIVEVEVNGSLIFSEPVRVRAIADDGAWGFVEGSTTGIAMDNMTVKERPAAPLGAPPTMPLGQTPPVDKPSGPASINPPSDGYRSETFDADEGTITISWPANIAEDSVADMAEWLKLLQKRIRRRAGVVSGPVGQSSGNNSDGEASG